MSLQLNDSFWQFAIWFWQVHVTIIRAPKSEPFISVRRLKMNTGTCINHKARAVHLLVILAWVGAGSLTVGFSPPYKPDRLELGPTIRVSTPDDVVADDGVSSLREAVIAANTNTASGAAAGECRAGR